MLIQSETKFITSRRQAEIYSKFLKRPIKVGEVINLEKQPIKTIKPIEKLWKNSNNTSLKSSLVSQS